MTAYNCDATDTVLIAIADIDLPTTPCRSPIIAHYASQMRDGPIFPPVLVERLANGRFRLCNGIGNENYPVGGDQAEGRSADSMRRI